MTTAISMSRSGRMPPKRRSMSPSARSGARPSSSAKRVSNSGSSSLPSSRSNSSSRPSSSLRNASRTRSDDSPSASQNAANDSKMFEVSTPPKSMSSPLRAGKRHLLRAARELDDALAEPAQERVVGGAGRRALVVALHEDDRLPQRQRAVPADLADRAPRALLVARDELLAGREALRAGDRVELELAQRRVVAVDPQRAQVADVGERGADRAHLPVEDRGEARRRLVRVDRVAQAKVAVDDRGVLLIGQVVAQPGADGLDLGDVARLVVLPQPGEAPQLALEVAGRLAEALQPAGLPVDRVDLDERVDELLADPPAPVGAVEALGDRVGDD